MSKRIYSLKITTLALLLIALCSNIKAAKLSEGFESPSASSTTNNGASITYPSGIWWTNGITKPTNATPNDRSNGLYSMRMRGLAGPLNTLGMKFDKAGAGVLSFVYGSYSNHRGGKLWLEKSTTGADPAPTVTAGWEKVGDTITVGSWLGTHGVASYNINYSGNIRFRIVMKVTSDANTQVNIDDIEVTDYGVDQAATPQFSTVTSVCSAPQSVSLTSSTPGAAIYYTTDGSTPTTASALYSTPLQISATTTLKAIAAVAGKEDSRVNASALYFPIEVSTLSALQALIPTATTSATGSVYYKYTGEAIVTQSYKGTYYVVHLQDATGGFMVYDNLKNLTQTYAVGDKVTGFVGLLTNYYSLPEIYPYADFTKLSSGNTVTPKEITLSQLADNLLCLVKIKDLNFAEANGTIAFNPNTPYTISDATKAADAAAYVFKSPTGMTIDYQSKIIPAKSDVVCLVSRYTTKYELFSRNLQDITALVSAVKSTIAPTIPRIYSESSAIMLESAVTTDVSVYSTTGTEVISTTVTAGKSRIPMTKGLYVVKAGDTVAKVLVK